MRLSKNNEVAGGWVGREERGMFWLCSYGRKKILARWDTVLVYGPGRW